MKGAYMSRFGGLDDVLVLLDDNASTGSIDLNPFVDFFEDDDHGRHEEGALCSFEPEGAHEV